MKTEDAIKAVTTIMRHRDLLRKNMGDIAHILEDRALLHDLSKLQEDEIDGFIRINKAAREHPYGSEEYQRSADSEKQPGGCIHAHFSRNSHHPEYHEHDQCMGFLDIIEMVCDWKAAADGYGTMTLRESLPIHEKRFNFHEGQWWLIQQVVDFLEPPN